MAVYKPEGRMPAQTEDAAQWTELDLQRPIYARTAVGGHFGRADMPWEKLDRTGLLMATLI